MINEKKLSELLEQFTKEIEPKCVKIVWRAYFRDDFEEKTLLDDIYQSREEAKEALAELPESGLFLNDDGKLEQEDTEATDEWGIEQEEVQDVEMLKQQLAFFLMREWGL